MTPETFQADALAWVAVLSTVATAALALVGYLLPKVLALKAQMKDTCDRLDRHRVEINKTKEQIVDVALLTTPPTNKKI